MNSRQRVLAVIDHQRPDRIPLDIWAVAEVRRKLADALGPHWPDALHVDGFGGTGAEYVGPALPPMPAGEGVDFWGIRRRDSAYPGGTYAEIYHHPLAAAETVDDLEAYPWPQADWFDYAPVAPRAALEHDAKAIQCGYMAPFTYHLYLRGLENALTDPLLRPDFTRHLLERLCGFLYEHHRRIFQAAEGLIDVTQVTDDYGMQTGAMMSLAVFGDFYKPHLKRFIDLAHTFGIKVFHHDDGAIRPFLPELVGLGIDVLNPIQWRCPGMDRAELKSAFGSRVCFHGGMDNQQTLPFGSVCDVRAEVRQNIDLLAGDGTGYILAPCHNLQALTPLENILAMYDEAWEYGKL